MMTDQTLISGAPRVKLKWYQVIDPITKLLFILDMTLLSFASMNLLLQAGLILVATLLLLFSKLSSTIFKALGFSLFLICTMLIIQGLFYSRNQTVLFSVLGVSFYKEGLIYATTLGCRVLVIILTSGFFMVTTSISENAAYLELSGLSYKTVYVLMSVCYILPEMMRNMRKIQQAQKVPLVIKTLDQSMARSISLQLRGFDNPNRTVRTSQRVYRLSRTLHIGLTGLAILLIGWKIWTKINGL